MSKRSVALKQIADAGAPLYQSLNDAQKARFTMLARMLRPHQHGFNGGERREGRNFDRDGRGQGGWRKVMAGADAGSAKTARVLAKAARMAKTVAAGATAICTT